MKTSDYVTVGFLAIFVTVVAYFSLNAILGDPSEASVRLEYLDGATSDLATPDKEVFNAAAINPTVEVYIGSCVDEDQDGVLDEQERKDCGMDAYETNTGATESSYSERNNGLSDDENEQTNAAQGYARGTTAQQRAAVESDVSEYQQQQTQNETTQGQSAADAAARQETVSGS